MAVKQVDVPGIGTVKLYKRKGSRSVRLSVSSTGEVKVSLPYWLPYDAGTRFALSKVDWIQAQLQERVTTILRHGQSVGKSHRFYFYRDSGATRISTRLNGSEIRIIYPDYLTADEASVQKGAERAAIRALRLQSERLLPQRLRALADTNGYTYKSIAIKHLTGRWGSCDSNKNIVLNLYLIQLPWHLIDYVVLHELAHTRVLNHGPDFWSEFERHLPHAKQLRREIKEYRPIVGA